MALEKKNIAARPNKRKYIENPACIISEYMPYISEAAPSNVIKSATHFYAGLLLSYTLFLLAPELRLRLNSSLLSR